MTLALSLPEYETSSLEPIERVLLESDGTLTCMLEAASQETIVAVKLAQHVVPAAERGDLLDVEAGELLMSRKVLLQGVRTGANYVFAESMIAVDRLEAPLRQGLLTSHEPIGRIWKTNRLETYKEVVRVRREPCGTLSRHFEINPDTRLLVRTYRVFSRGKPVMLITEYFSALLASTIAKATDLCCPV
jgi:chorismate-pyruvate lyase